jgi:hypothetical protein
VFPPSAKRAGRYRVVRTIKLEREVLTEEVGNGLVLRRRMTGQVIVGLYHVALVKDLRH